MGERILIADDHGIVRMGLVKIIKELYQNSFIKEVDDYKTLFEILNKEKFDLLILDINMPNGTFLEAIEYIKIKQNELKILVFSAQDESLFAIRYLKMGAQGFLNKFSCEDDIKLAIVAMIEKGKFLSNDVKDSLISSSINKNESNENPLDVLSNREVTIANKLIEGTSLKELSNTLNLHSSTISTYKTRIFQKLEISSLPELIEIFKLYRN